MERRGELEAYQHDVVQQTFPVLLYDHGSGRLAWA